MYHIYLYCFLTNPLFLISYKIEYFFENYKVVNNLNWIHKDNIKYIFLRFSILFYYNSRI
jgi:hypothetical protein